MALVPPLSIRLAGDAERVRQSTHDAIREIQSAPGVGMLVVSGVFLASGVRTPVPHSLGRAPSWIGASCVRGALAAGSVAELVDGVDRSQRVDLTAVGFGADVTIDLLVVP